MTCIALEEIKVQSREVGVEGQIYAIDENPPASTRKGEKRRESRKGQNSASGHDFRETQRHNPLVPNSSQDHEVLRGDVNVGPSRHPADRKEKDRELPREGFRAQFYEDYHREAEEYDKQFMKNHEEDLNTTLIFAGLLSAVTSAFIIQVHPQLQQDPTDETAALIRVILYKMDNTTFGGNTPPLPQWTGPPRPIVYTLAMLYASLAASFFSAFLAMLGKQWLNRYASINMRGCIIERSQDRQRKLDGIVTWYFDYVMESLSLMLQVALLLLGCALSRYLWGMDVTVACVVLGATAFGVIFYVFVVVAGTASASCPYQTPCARTLRHIRYHTLPYIVYHIFPHIRYHILPSILSLFHSAFRAFIINSTCLLPFSEYVWSGWFDWKRNIFLLLNYILCFPFLLANDTHQLIWATVRGLTSLACRTCSWIRSASSAQTHGSDQQVTTLDSPCISWMLQTSLEKATRLSTLKFLATTSTLTDFTPTLVSGCFGILIDCIKVNEGNPVIIQGMEQLVELSVMHFFLAYSHLSVMDPMSSVLVGIHQRYRRIFPHDLDFNGLPSRHTLGAIHEAIYSDPKVEVLIEWGDYKPTNHEHVAVAHALSKLSWSQYKRRKLDNVPFLCLSFALHYLSKDPLPPPSITADCLLIIAIYLGCDVPKTMVLGESARPEKVSDLIIQKLGAVHHQYQNLWETEVIDVLFWYAVNQERYGDTNLFDAILRPKERRSDRRGSQELDWHLGGSKIFIYASPRAAVLTGPYINWGKESPDMNAQALISKWVAAISVAQHTEEVAQDVVYTLLQIAANRHLRPSIPADVWLWLNERPSLTPVCRGDYDIIQTVRALNDIGILTSYLIMIWSEWKRPDCNGYPDMQMSVREDFNGIGMSRHRAELIQRLDYILGELDRRSGCLGDDWLWHREVAPHSLVMKVQYEDLRRILQEVDQEAT